MAPGGLSRATSIGTYLQVGVPSDGDGIAYQEMFTFLRNNPQSLLANYQGMQARLDMTEFVDYLLQNIYTCTGDWPHNNWIAARERSTSGKFQVLHLGRRRRVRRVWPHGDEQQLCHPAAEQRRSWPAKLAGRADAADRLDHRWVRRFSIPCCAIVPSSSCTSPTGSRSTSSTAER
jgi:hypothetical protein